MAVDTLRQLVQLCDQFEAQWRAGEPPRIEALIADLDEPLRRQATEDLIAIELHWMRRLGERNLLGTYSERFPEHAPFIAQQCGGAGGAVVEDRRRPDFPPIGGTSKLEGGEHSDSAPAAAGRFRAVRPHASGGLGRIWLALDAELKREVAIKELLNEHANRPDARERFVLEAEVTARLEHPGIVPVYGLGTAPDGRPFYAMRLIQGKSLEVAIQELHETSFGSPFAAQRLLETRRLLNRFLAVCAAIDFAHSRGVIHRDIKPANVMLGEFGETLVVDWGMALLRSPPGEASSGAEIPNSRTEEEGGARILGGTPQYMSPEQAAGDERAIGPASDIYNLGATLYQLLTGRPAFPKASTPSVVLDAVQRADFAPPRQVCPTVPAVLQAVCLKAMAREPGDRYASARALSEDLERWLADEPVAAYREPMGERLARVFRKHRLAVLVGTLGLVAITLAALVATLLVYRASREETRLRLLAEFRTRESQAALARVEQQERAARDAQQAAETQERVALAARQAAELQERRARAATDFLASIFATSDPLGLRGMGLRKVADQGRPLTPLEILNRGLERVDQELAGDPLLQATLLDALGSAYLGQGDLEQAAKLIERAWETRRSRLPERHPELLASMTSRASLMIVDGRMSEAESLLRVVLASQETDATAEELKVAETRFLLALALREQYQVDESMKLLRGSLAVRDKRQGLTHPDTLLARTLLVDSLLNQNRQAEATIEGMKLVSGDPRTASLLVGGLMRFQQMENLRRQRQFEAAAKIGDGLRSEATKVLGDSHPLTATLHFHHAMLWRQQGKRLEADALTERVLGQLSVAVARMPRMSEVYYRLAQSVAERGQHEAAERHFRDAYSTGGTIYIKENAWGLKAGFALAGFLRDRGRGDAAVTLAREVLKRVPAQ
ncbi:MAG: Serine/threonine-protein kinase PknD, partial [Planctomycetota bacterium]